MKKLLFVLPLVLFFSIVSNLKTVEAKTPHCAHHQISVWVAKKHHKVCKVAPKKNTSVLVTTVSPGVYIPPLLQLYNTKEEINRLRIHIQ